MVRLWDTVSGKELRQIPWLGGYIGALAMTSDGKSWLPPWGHIRRRRKKVMVGSRYGKRPPASESDVIRPGVNYPRAANFTPGLLSRWVEVCYHHIGDSGLDFAAKKKVGRILERATTPNSHLAFSPDGKFIVTPAVKVSKADTGEKRLRWRSPPAPTLSLGLPMVRHWQ